MKELSIEEKAKAYDEAYKVAEKIHKFSSDLAEIKRMEQIFPELKESEDGKIRKELITHCKNIRCVTEEFAERKAKWIAWLEKQGGITKLSEEEQSRFAKGVLSSCAMSFINYLDAHKYENKMCVSNGECEDIENAFHNAMWDRLHRYYCKYIEKQGEKSQAQSVMETWKAMRLEVYQQASGNRHELNYSDDTTKMFSLNDIDEIIEKISEQKHDDKVEPKFKNGQWIVWQDKCYKVNYNGCGYELVDQNGLSTSLEYGTIDENAHLWDITKDAKDGDVLFYKGNLRYSNEIKFDRICLFNTLDNAFFTVSKYSNGIEDYGVNENIDYPDNIMPATKEQKEILFMTMKEEGYEWDAERKELKKTEQKSAWNKEDEMIALSIEQVMNCASLLNIVPEKMDKIRTWLKSLKDKYTWKPSKEQMQALSDAGNSFRPFEKGHKVLWSLYNDLKKLKEE